MPSPTRSLDRAAVRRIVAGLAFAEATGDRVGIELEWLQHPHAGARRLSVPELAAELAGHELPAGSTLTYEPGGQVELSTPPFATVGEACEAAESDTAAVRLALVRCGIDLIGRGLDATAPSDLATDEPRYVAMRRYLDRGGPSGGRMMCQTAALQLNLDAGADREGVRRWHVAHALGPTLVAMFANSPLDGWRSARIAAWLRLDRSRTLPVPGGSDPSSAWAEYALNANVMFIRGDRTYEPIADDLPFARWVDEGHDLGYPDADDVEYHLTTLFPPVRPRGWLELRMIDMLPDPWWRAAAAVTTALVTDREASAVAERACRGAEHLWEEAARDGLADPALAAAALACFQAALPALTRVGVDALSARTAEDYFERFVARRRTPADDAGALEEAM